MRKKRWCVGMVAYRCIHIDAEDEEGVRRIAEEQKGGSELVDVIHECIASSSVHRFGGLE